MFGRSSTLKKKKKKEEKGRNYFLPKKFSNEENVPSIKRERLEALILDMIISPPD